MACFQRTVRPRVLRSIYNPRMHWKDWIADLVCPACRQPLALGPGEVTLRCAACHRVYPVRDDIPILLVDEAKVED